MKKDNSIPRYDIAVYTSANKNNYKTGLTHSTYEMNKISSLRMIFLRPICTTVTSLTNKITQVQ